MTALSMIAAAEWGGEFEGVLDDIVHLFDMPTIIDLGIFSINRTILIIFLMTLVAVLLFFTAFRNASPTGPSKLQLAVESVVGFVRENIALEIIGPRGLKFVPLLTTMFVFIFLLNFAKITPLLMLPPTSRMSIVLFLDVISWLVYVGVGISEHGFGGYFKNVAVPPGVPALSLVLLTPIELVSTLILRPFTLAIRLFANMVAGHILVVITIVTIHVFLPSFPVGWTIGLFGLILSPIVFAFEFFIIALQAYIFTMLTAVYIQSSLEMH